MKTLVKMSILCLLAALLSGSVDAGGGKTWNLSVKNNTGADVVLTGYLDFSTGQDRDLNGPAITIPKGGQAKLTAFDCDTFNPELKPFVNLIYKVGTQRRVAKCVPKLNNPKQTGIFTLPASN